MRVHALFSNNSIVNDRGVSDVSSNELILGSIWEKLESQYSHFAGVYVLEVLVPSDRFVMNISSGSSNEKRCDSVKMYLGLVLVAGQIDMDAMSG